MLHQLQLEDFLTSVARDARASQEVHQEENLRAEAALAAMAQEEDTISVADILGDDISENPLDDKIEVIEGDITLVVSPRGEITVTYKNELTCIEGSRLSMDYRISLVKEAIRLWKEVEPTLPQGKYSCMPAGGDGRAFSREKLYKRLGFEINPSSLWGELIYVKA